MRERVLSWSVPGPVDPEAAFAALYADSADAFWLDSGGTGDGVSYLGAAASVVTADAIRADGEGVLDRLAAECAAWDVDTADAPPGFRLGLVGWLGYELHVETIGVPAPYPRRHPEALLLRVDRALAVDAATGAARLLARGTEWAGELAEWRDRTLETLAALGSVPADSAPASEGAVLAAPAPLAASRVPRGGLRPDGLSERPASSQTVTMDGSVVLDARAGTGPAGGAAVARWRYTDAEYADMIRECQAAIADGEAYVLCLTTEVAVDGAFDAWEVYRRLRRSSPSHHGAFIRSGGVSLLSSSPEQFLRVDPGGRVVTKPIKGTRPRGATPEEDGRLREELRTSEKERAENVMIVDLMRNDLARVCEPGSVEVERLLEVETYPPVHQLVSTVAGRLAAGRTAIDAIRSCFPAGSMTGAPKHSAVTILGRLEGRSRGVYSGAFGYLGLDGAVDLAMTIRSIVIDSAGATIGTGGGITALSEPAEEVAEAHLKARALLAALGAEDAAMGAGEGR